MQTGWGFGDEVFAEKVLIQPGKCDAEVHESAFPPPKNQGMSGDAFPASNRLRTKFQSALAAC
jgi:hypothetical protein